MSFGPPTPRSPTCQWWHIACRYGSGSSSASCRPSAPHVVPSRLQAWCACAWHLRQSRRKGPGPAPPEAHASSSRPASPALSAVPLPLPLHPLFPLPLRPANANAGYWTEAGSRATAVADAARGANAAGATRGTCAGAAHGACAGAARGACAGFRSRARMACIISARDLGFDAGSGKRAARGARLGSGALGAAGALGAGAATGAADSAEGTACDAFCWPASSAAAPADIAGQHSLVLKSAGARRHLSVAVSY
eukprot:2979976-Pleurochrysis_carterae.AAC.1